MSTQLSGNQIKESDLKALFAAWNLETNWPVGSYWISDYSTNPDSIVGGTWEQVKDTFILAAGDTYTAGSTGGEAAHTLAQSELPSVQLEMKLDDNTLYYNNSNNSGFTVTQGTSNTAGTVLKTESLGGGVAHNNMPPYVAAYIFRRIA